MNKYLILANGKAPSKPVIRYLLKLGYTQLICADGGANKARKMGLRPSIIIGDLDSIHQETLDYFTPKCKILKIKGQDDTDVEKCLKYLIKNDATEVLLLGVTGDRLDHTFCNLGIVLKYYNIIQTRIIAENSILVPISGKVKIKTSPGEIISLYGFDSKTKITATGLRYPLTEESLPFGVRESTSNVAVKNEVKINVSRGVIFVIRELNILKKNGLFQ